MKTKLSILAIIPALMLASCSNNNEIKDEAKVNELKAQITAKLKDIRNFELKVSSSASAYDEDLKKNTSRSTTITYLSNEAQEKYIKSSTTSDNLKADLEVFLVNNETYKKVYYTSTHDPETKKDEVKVYGYDGNELIFSLADLTFSVPEAYLNLFANPSELDLEEISAADEEHDYEVTTKYYSKGAGNLTVKATSKLIGEVNKDEEEYAVDTHYTIVYEDYCFKSAHLDSKSSKGNKGELDATLTVKDKVTIELPQGWEELINKPTAEEE